MPQRYNLWQWRCLRCSIVVNFWWIWHWRCWSAAPVSYPPEVSFQLMSATDTHYTAMATYGLLFTFFTSLQTFLLLFQESSICLEIRDMRIIFTITSICSTPTDQNFNSWVKWYILSKHVGNANRIHLCKYIFFHYNFVFLLIYKIFIEF